MDDHPLAFEQITSVRQPVQASKDAANLAAQLSEQALRQSIPSGGMLEAYELAVPESQCLSLDLLRGLRLLSRLAGGMSASLDELAADLHLSPSKTGVYIRTLTMTGMIEEDPNTRVYRLAK